MPYSRINVLIHNLEIMRMLFFKVLNRFYFWFAILRKLKTKYHKKWLCERKVNFLLYFFGKIDKFLQFFLMHSEIMLFIYISITNPVLYDMILKWTTLTSIDNNHGGLTRRQWVGSWVLTNLIRIEISVYQFLFLCNKDKTTQFLIANCIINKILYLF